MKNSFYILKLSQVPDHLESHISQYCIQQGASGVSESLDFIQTQDQYEPVTLEKDYHNLDVYFETPPSREFLITLSMEYPEVQFAMEEEQNKDWLEEWKKDYQSFPLVDQIWVVPSWLEPPMESQKSILIDPGMAFGTGTHMTTQIAAELLWEHLQKDSPKTLLDVGTGTGILGILARYLGVPYVVATEIDKVAREVARENRLKNKVENIDILDVQIESLETRFPLIVANIIDGVLLKIKEDLHRLLLPGGHFILTGILEEREKSFIQNFDITEKDIKKRIQKEEWVGLLVQKGNP